MAWSLVTPASRGIGFHLTRHLLSTTQLPVLATARKDLASVEAALVAGLGAAAAARLTLVQVDLTDEASIAAAAATARTRFAKTRLRRAFCLPGQLWAERAPRQLDAGQLHATFALNTIAPLLLIKHFSAFLPATAAAATPAVWLNMSARVGSTTDNRLGGWYSYRASKAAVNSLTKTFDLHLQARCGPHAMAMSYHPGTVKTDLSKNYWDTLPPEKLFSPEFAVCKMTEVVDNLDVDGRGKCYDWRGEVIPP
ncbi:short-chain dehydrogenase [Blumeria hordei DH14]|uniref:Short-chain dehydrogenase n=1 Tax=Blumeria graminis f. sp. hordei (strain DH14) TaxID=546991 RepID=N1JL80_BLUG1|nr:short-chain dehydrogenase [Blumeria hordei DH14]